VPVAVVTDSAANLTEAMAAERDVTVVPLQVVIGDQAYDEGSPEATPSAVASALREFVPVSTSRPSPRRFVETYTALADQGFEEIVSVHLSGDMSGTVESAQIAAREVEVPVTVLDSRQVGVATGFAVLTAAGVAASGAPAEEVTRVARWRSAAATSLFYVDTLEYLRRGGRIGAAAAWFGGALAVKPLLEIVDGRVQTKEKVRTAGRALGRLEELAAEAAQDRSVDVCVLHLAGEERATRLRDSITERLAGPLEGREVWCGEVGAALAAHVGPGMVAVCGSPLDSEASTHL
jgi:DegV family protein with EDD domain